MMYLHNTISESLPIIILIFSRGRKWGCETFNNYFPEVTESKPMVEPDTQCRSFPALQLGCSVTAAPIVCYLSALCKKRTIFVPTTKKHRSQYLLLLRTEEITGVSSQNRELSASPGLRELRLGSSAINHRHMLWIQREQKCSTLLCIWDLSAVRVMYGREEIVFTDPTRWCDLGEL